MRVNPHLITQQDEAWRRAHREGFVSIDPLFGYVFEERLPGRTTEGKKRAKPRRIDHPASDAPDAPWVITWPAPASWNLKPHNISLPLERALWLAAVGMLAPTETVERIVPSLGTPIWNLQVLRDGQVVDRGDRHLNRPKEADAPFHTFRADAFYPPTRPPVEASDMELASDPPEPPEPPEPEPPEEAPEPVAPWKRPGLTAQDAALLWALGTGVLHIDVHKAQVWRLKDATGADLHDPELVTVSDMGARAPIFKVVLPPGAPARQLAMTLPRAVWLAAFSEVEDGLQVYRYGLSGSCGIDNLTLAAHWSAVPAEAPRPEPAAEPAPETQPEPQPEPEPTETEEPVTTVTTIELPVTAAQALTRRVPEAIPVLQVVDPQPPQPPAPRLPLRRLYTEECPTCGTPVDVFARVAGIGQRTAELHYEPAAGPETELYRAALFAILRDPTLTGSEAFDLARRAIETAAAEYNRQLPEWVRDQRTRPAEGGR